MLTLYFLPRTSRWSLRTRGITVVFRSAEWWALRGELLVTLPLRRNDEIVPAPPVDDAADEAFAGVAEGSIENDLAKFDSICSTPKVMLPQ